MGAETRIGIVTGLIIVVVASVYFFYGNEGSEKDFLVSADAKVSLPPKIPATVNQKRTAAPSQSEAQTEKRPRAVTMSPGTRRQLVLGNNGSRQAPGVPTGARSPRNGRGHVTQPRPGQVGGTSPTVLRGSPAEELIHATQENLDQREPGSGAPGLTSPEVQPPLGNEDGTVRTEPHQPAMPITDRSHSAETRTTPPPKTPEPLERAAPPSQPTRHTVGSGETLSGIAQTYYGSSAKYQLILAANPDIRNPNAIPVGQVLVIPPEAGQAASPQRREPGPARSASPPRGRTYRVQEGDTFYAIAQRMLGSGARWQEIYRLNSSLVRNDPKRLKPGMVIKLPE